MLILFLIRYDPEHDGVFYIGEAKCMLHITGIKNINYISNEECY